MNQDQSSFLASFKRGGTRQTKQDPALQLIHLLVFTHPQHPYYHFIVVSSTMLDHTPTSSAQYESIDILHGSYTMPSSIYRLSTTHLVNSHVSSINGGHNLSKYIADLSNKYVSTI